MTSQPVGTPASNWIWAEKTPYRTNPQDAAEYDVIREPWIVEDPNTELRRPATTSIMSMLFSDEYLVRLERRLMLLNTDARAVNIQRSCQVFEQELHKCVANDTQGPKSNRCKKMFQTFMQCAFAALWPITTERVMAIKNAAQRRDITQPMVDTLFTVLRERDAWTEAERVRIWGIPSTCSTEYTMMTDVMLEPEKLHQGHRAELAQEAFWSCALMHACPEQVMSMTHCVARNLHYSHCMREASRLMSCKAWVSGRLWIGREKSVWNTGLYHVLSGAAAVPDDFVEDIRETPGWTPPAARLDPSPDVSELPLDSMPGFSSRGGSRSKGSTTDMSTGSD